MSLVSENIELLEKIALDEAREWYSDYVPYYYIKLREQTNNQKIIDILNTIGDERMLIFLNDIFIVNNGNSIYNKFAQFLNTTELYQIFYALEKRIEENSLLLNHEIYKVLLEAYHSYQEIQKRYDEDNQKYNEKIQKLVSDRNIENIMNKAKKIVLDDKICKGS